MSEDLLALFVIILILNTILFVFVLLTFLRSKNRIGREDLKNVEAELKENIEQVRTGVGENMSNVKSGITETLDRSIEAQNRILQNSHESTKTLLDAQSKSTGASLDLMQKAIKNSMDQMSETIKQLQQSQSQQIETLTKTVSGGMENLRATNETQLKEIRKTVDEELQETLNKRIKESFDSVIKSLQEVQTGLGEMKTLANSVGDLKKTLSNTKARGILGEAQLGAILEQFLAPDQYETNIATVRGSRNPVEFAIKLPGDGDGSFVYLPIDSKFPLDCYQNLLEAYDSGEQAVITAAQKELEQRIMGEAKDVKEKYIHVPETTEFGIIFLASEGLYAEACRLGLIEKLQTKYQINIAGPTTICAFLNSLQMGFRTLAIQKRSAEVWKLLGGVKTEFEKFGQALEQTQSRINQAGNELEKLVGVRTRQINRQLAGITTDSLPQSEQAMLTESSEI